MVLVVRLGTMYSDRCQCRVGHAVGCAPEDHCLPCRFCCSDRVRVGLFGKAAFAQWPHACSLALLCPSRLGIRNAILASAGRIDSLCNRIQCPRHMAICCSSADRQRAFHVALCGNKFQGGNCTVSARAPAGRRGKRFSRKAQPVHLAGVVVDSCSECQRSGWKVGRD